MNLLTRFLLGPLGMLADDVKYLLGKKDDTVYGSVGRVLKGQSDGSNVLDNVFHSALGKYTGSNLTGAEREANEFNAGEAEKQRNWEERMANTQYQRGVADMSTAGVNPALMFGSGQAAPTPSGAAASGVTPSFSGLADLMSLIMLPAQIKNLNAQTRNIDEKTRTQEQITKIQTIAANYGVEYTEAQISSMLAVVTEKVAEANYKQSLKDLVVSQTVAQDTVNKYLDERQRSEIDKIVAEKDKLSADEKLAKAQAFFTNVQANYADSNGYRL